MVGRNDCKLLIFIKACNVYRILILLHPFRKERPQIGEVSEWPNERAWKVRVLAMVPWVRIPPSPQRNAVRPKADGIFCFRRYEHSSYKHGTKNDNSGVKRSDSISLLVPP